MSAQVLSALLLLRKVFCDGNLKSSCLSWHFFSQKELVSRQICDKHLKILIDVAFST